MGTVESVSVIDHARHEAGAAAGGIGAPHHGAIEYRLAAVGIAHPLVEHQDGAEVLQVGHLGQQGIGEKIVDGDAARVARILRAELPAGLDIHAPRAKLHAALGIGGQETRAHLDQGGLGRGDLQIAEQSGTERLVDQNAAVLGVVAELDDIPLTVVGLQQMGLGAAAHFSDVPDRSEGHRKENAVT